MDEASKRLEEDIDTLHRALRMVQEDRFLGEDPSEMQGIAARRIVDLIREYGLPVANYLNLNPSS